MTKSAKSRVRPDPKWDDLRKVIIACPDNPPTITIVIPTYNCAHTIVTTLDSVLAQEYPRLEVIVIDANSTDGTPGVLKHYVRDQVSVHTVASYNIYEMLNWGISLANGEYVNFLFPGDFYLSKYSTLKIVELVLAEEKPDIAYCGSLIRGRDTTPRVLYRRLSRKLLRNGQQPTSLQACWFKTDSLKLIGKFDVSLSLRGGFDLFCRFFLDERMRVCGMSQALTDYSERVVTYRAIARHFWENFLLIRKYFGRRAVMRWLRHQRDLRRAFAEWRHALRLAFLGK